MGAFDRDRSYEDPKLTRRAGEHLADFLIANEQNPEQVLVAGNEIHDAADIAYRHKLLPPDPVMVDSTVETR
jgi:hypothetical protein